MAFTVSELHDLITILEKQPEWRAELRRVLLSDALLALPQQVQQLTEAQQQAADRLGRVEASIGHLQESIGRLEEVVRGLGEAQRTTEAVLQTTVDSVGALKGMALEQRHQERPHAHFSCFGDAPTCAHVGRSDRSGRRSH